jgi:hypothetical protein
MSGNHPSRPFFLALTVALLLWVAGFVQREPYQVALTLRPVNPLGAVLPFAPRAQATENADDDLLALPGDAADAAPAPAAASAPVAPPPPAVASRKEGAGRFLAAFAAANSAATLRIAYLGDSFVEGDLVTADLRRMLQRRQGGAGVGFVPMTSITAGFRTSIRHEFSDDWEDYSFQRPGRPHRPIGLSGHVFYAARAATGATTSTTSWAEFAPPRGAPPFQRMRLIHGPGRAGDFVRANGTDYPLAGSAPVNALTFPVAGAARLRLEFHCAGPTPLYGVVFDSPHGAFLDNYSFRGSTGLSFARLDPGVLAGWQRALGYDLVVLHYGLNVQSPKMTDYRWYQARMSESVRVLRDAMPEAEFLIVSMSDKGTKVDGAYHPDAGVAPLVETQRLLADASGAAFWNLFEAMGGSGSMGRWADERPTLAQSDYTHLYTAGARRVAELFYTWMENESRLVRRASR